MDPKVVQLLIEFGLLDPSLAEVLGDLSALSADELSRLRQELAVAVGRVDPSSADDDDIAMLDACASAVRAISQEFSGRISNAQSRAEAAKQIIATMTAAAETPAPQEARLPRISHLAHRRPGRVRPLRRFGRGPQVLNASGEQADASDVVDLVGRALRDEWRQRTTAQEGPARPVPILSLRVEYPEDRLLGQDEERNAALIAAVASPAAITASGGVCAPVAVDYSVDSIGVADRPVKEALAQFGASRGGIRYVLPHTLAAVTTDGPAVLWTQANDVLLNNPSTKPHATFSCQPVQETYVDAVTSIVQFGNFQARYFPEQIQQYLDTVDAVQARLAESTLLASISSGSTQVNAGSNVLGAASELLADLDRIVAAYRYRHRMAADAPLRLLYPEFLDDMLRADLARELPGNSGGQSERLAMADAELDRFYTSRGIVPTGYLDSPTGASTLQGWGVQGVGDALPWPTKVVGFLFHEGAWMFLDGGELNLGTVRDSTLNRTNDFQMFSETFEKAVFRGHESLAITWTLCPFGSRAATATTTSLCTSGS